ncbi:MAG TPA: acyl-homoserine-lactone synthase [Microvirga sp.]|nr:acyl-homoserine-lactone synthase [Microvirga sp.]
MFHIITPGTEASQRGILEAAYRFRHRVFVERMGWEALRRPDNREVDQFDGLPCIHVVGMEDGSVFGYSRLLPTTGPHLLSDVYPEILGGATAPRRPDVWEWTRMAVAPERREGQRGADRTTGRVYAAAVETGLMMGLTAFINQFNPIYITRMLELGFEARPLSLPTTYAGEPIVAMYLGISETTLATIRAVFDLDEPVLDAETLAPVLPPRPSPAAPSLHQP